MMKSILLLGILAQLIPGSWFLEKPIVRQGLIENDAIVFSLPAKKIAAGTYVQFGVNLENLGDKAPRHYMVEVKEGRRWRCISSIIFNDGKAGYSFETVRPADRHPSSYQEIFRLRRTVRDSLTVRCRVCSNYAADFSTLSAAEEDNRVEVKSRSYVGARLQPLGRKKPGKSATVLLLGNSFTYFFGEPLLLQEIAFSQGLDLNIISSLKGGLTFRGHAGLELSRKACKAARYDFAFIQGQSQEPARFADTPAQYQDIKDALCELCDSIRVLSPLCDIYVENTWAYENGLFGGFESMDGFDLLLHRGSAALADACRGKVSPVGAAFGAARAASIREGLYDYDAKHPGLAGAYLKACVTCLVISRRPFSPDVPACGLPEQTAAELRRIAETIVL